MSVSLAGRVADFFEEHPNEWIDGRAVAAIGGCYGWRTRIADARRPPFNLHIVNRQRRVQDDRGTFVVSEYMNITTDAPRPAA